MLGPNSYVSLNSIVFYAIVISVALQLVTYISFGCLADHGSYRKKLMYAFSYATAISGMCLLLVLNNSLWWISYILFILSGVTFGSSYVYYYAHVPLLTRSSEDVIKARRTGWSLHYLQNFWTGCKWDFWEGICRSFPLPLVSFFLAFAQEYRSFNGGADCGPTAATGAPGSCNDCTLAPTTTNRKTPPCSSWNTFDPFLLDDQFVSCPWHLIFWWLCLRNHGNFRGTGYLLLFFGHMVGFPLNHYLADRSNNFCVYVISSY
jgi:hypothetical protein